MKRYLLGAVAAVAIAAPAQARDGAAYFGVEGGILFPKDQDADAAVLFDTTQTVVTTPLVAGPADFHQDNAIGIDYKMGIDLDAIIGYDFGMFRLEGELGWKKAKLDDLEFDDDFISD